MALSKSREKLCHTTAALSTIHKGQQCCLLLLMQCCTFGCILLIPSQLLPLATAPSDAVLQICQPNVCRMCYMSMYVYEAVCLCEKPVWRWWQLKLCQDCGPHSWSSASFKGLGRTTLEGPGNKGERLYLSPRIAYWLSSCKCCIDAPMVSSLPRFLCFTTSKVFSISLSLKHRNCNEYIFEYFIK